LDEYEEPFYFLSGIGSDYWRGYNDGELMISGGLFYEGRQMKESLVGGTWLGD
jgi:hypothetical protein